MSSAFPSVLVHIHTGYTVGAVVGCMLHLAQLPFVCVFVLYLPLGEAPVSRMHGGHNVCPDSQAMQAHTTIAAHNIPTNILVKPVQSVSFASQTSHQIHFLITVIPSCTAARSNCCTGSNVTPTCLRNVVFSLLIGRPGTCDRRQLHCSSFVTTPTAMVRPPSRSATRPSAL